MTNYERWALEVAERLGGGVTFNKALTYLGIGLAVVTMWIVLILELSPRHSHAYLNAVADSAAISRELVRVRAMRDHLMQLCVQVAKEKQLNVRDICLPKE